MGNFKEVGNKTREGGFEILKVDVFKVKCVPG